jgi:hypothetical protein
MESQVLYTGIKAKKGFSPAFLKIPAYGMERMRYMKMI